MHQKKEKKIYYTIRVELFWGMMLCYLFLLIAGIYGSYRFWEPENAQSPMEKGQIRIEVTFEGWRSELKDSDQCYLCGEHTGKHTDACRNPDTIALISLNDWTIVNFQINGQQAEDREEQDKRDSGTQYGKTEEISYLSNGNPDRGMAEIHVTLLNGCHINNDFLRQNLCQTCLDQITASLCFWKWEQEKKEAVPLCLIDFQTFEIYPVQDWYRAYFIRDYWIQMDFEENSISLNAFYLPLS